MVPVESETSVELLNKQKQVLSPLQLAKKNAKNGQIVNACPFGCEPRNLDEHGYCKHLIGVTLPGDPKKFEPMKRVKGRYQIVVPREKIVFPLLDGEEASDKPEYEWGPPQYGAVEKGDVLVRITSSSRVYREHVPEPTRTPPPKAMSAAEKLALLKQQLADLEVEAELEAEAAAA